MVKVKNKVEQTSPFHRKVMQVIKSIPRGQVSSYGRIAELAGKHGGARQVAWFLHSSSRKYRLPWHRVVNAQGKISLPDPHHSQQKRLLKREGVVFTESGKISKEFFFVDKKLRRKITSKK